jgi:Mg-chelatase subunit ChlD
MVSDIFQSPNLIVLRCAGMIAEKIINKMLCSIVSQTRTHPAVVRGVSVRGAIAFKEVLWGLSALRGAVTEECIHRAAMITLPPRMYVREGEDKSTVVEDIVNAVLGGRALFGSSDEEPAFREGLIFPEETLEGLPGQERPFPRKTRPRVNEEESFSLEEEWAEDFLNKENLPKKPIRGASSSRQKNPRRGNAPMGNLNHSGGAQQHGRPLDVPNEFHGPGRGISQKELAKTILEFMDVQDSRRGGNIDSRQMNIYYHMKANRAREEIPEAKHDYHNLMVLIHDLEEKGILKAAAGKDHEFTLSGEALQMLFELFFEKDTAEKSFQGFRDFKRELFHERRHEVRKYTSGDVFRNISFRHTLREIVRRKKKLSEVTRSDFRVFLHQPPKRAFDIVLCVDTSASMASHHKLLYARLASMGIAHKAINEGDRVALVAFDNSGRAVVPFHDKDTMRHYLVRLKARGNTNMAEGIRRADRLISLERTRRQKHIFLITDGYPTALSTKDYELLDDFKGKNLSEESVILEVRKAASKGTIVSVVHVTAQGEETNSPLVKRIARAGKGRIYPVQTREGLKAFMP